MTSMELTGTMTAECMVCGILHCSMTEVNAIGFDGENRTWALSVRGEGNLPQVASGTLALKGEIVREWGTVDLGLQPVTAATIDEEALDAWGGYVEGEYTFDNAYAPYFGLGYIYMSGDDDDSDPIEQFNPLFEDEKYGEIAEVSMASNIGISVGNPFDTMMTNASIWKFAFGFNPTENTALTLPITA